VARGGEWPMSSPSSAMMTWAALLPMPGTSSRRCIAGSGPWAGAPAPLVSPGSGPPAGAWAAGIAAIASSIRVVSWAICVVSPSIWSSRILARRASQEAGVVVVRASKPHQGRDHFLRRDLPVEEAPGQPYLLRAVAALGEDLWRILLRPTTVAAGIEQHEMRHVVRTPQRVLEGHLAAERMAEHGPVGR
jgi:hypothetical protein